MPREPASPTPINTRFIHYGSWNGDVYRAELAASGEVSTLPIMPIHARPWIKGLGVSIGWKVSRQKEIQE